MSDLEEFVKGAQGAVDELGFIPTAGIRETLGEEALTRPSEIAHQAYSLALGYQKRHRPGRHARKLEDIEEEGQQAYYTLLHAAEGSNNCNLQTAVQSTNLALIEVREIQTAATSLDSAVDTLVAALANLMWVAGEVTGRRQELLSLTTAT